MKQSNNPKSKPLSHLRDLLVKEAIDAILITSQPNIIYLTGYAGFSAVEREAYLLITKNSQYIFTDLRYTEAIKELVSNYSLKEITAQTPFLKQLEAVGIAEKINVLGFEADNLTVAEFSKIKPLVSTSNPVSLRSFRVNKTSEEIETIKKACTLGDHTFEHIVTKIKPGMTEKEIALEMELYIRKHGGKLSFPTIVAFGKNSAVPHHLTSDQQLQTTDIVLLDFGVEIDSYCSDMTRTVFFSKPTAEQRKVYETVYTAQQKAIELLQNTSYEIPNTEIKASDVDKISRDYITSQHFPSIPHSVGHGIGIEVHEAPTLSPKSNDKLEEGIVFSIEPGIYLPGNFGVRIEDLFAIQDGKLIQLTNAPKDLIEL